MIVSGVVCWEDKIDVDIMRQWKSSDRMVG